MPPEAFAEGILKVGFGLIVYFILSVVILVSTKKAKWIPLAILAPFIYVGISIPYYDYKNEKNKKEEREHSRKTREKLDFFCKNEFFMIDKKFPKDTDLSFFVQPSEPSQLIMEGTPLYNNLMQACTKKKEPHGNKMTLKEFCQNKYRPYKWWNHSSAEGFLHGHFKKAHLESKTEARYIFFTEEVSTLAERKKGIHQLRFAIKDNKTGKLIAEFRTFSTRLLYQSIYCSDRGSWSTYKYFFDNIIE